MSGELAARVNGVVYLVVMLSNIQTSIIRVFTIANLAELANLKDRAAGGHAGGQMMSVWTEF